MDFSTFDRRRYPTLGVVEGYGEWADTYEATVPDALDLRLLDRVTSVEWAAIDRAADLACGTGRTAAWLRERGVRSIDGVDLTPQMLERARTRGSHASLTLADIRETGLQRGTYDLVINVLADEHLPGVRPLYAEAARLLTVGGALVLVGYHPHFLMEGIPTHFDRPDGTSVAIQSHVHLASDHVAAGLGAGLRLAEMREAVVDEAWIERKPKWAPLRNRPISFAFVWRREG